LAPKRVESFGGKKNILAGKKIFWREKNILAGKKIFWREKKYFGGKKVFWLNLFLRFNPSFPDKGRKKLTD
jgi:hypothetical protein